VEASIAGGSTIMKMCKEHWQCCRDSVARAGLEHLVAKSGEEAARNTAAEIRGEPANFDPLMSMNWHWVSSALQNGGLYLLSKTDDETVNEGYHCPICEYTKHVDGFSAQEECDKIAEQMRTYCVKQGFVTVN
jgi:hypothetical protein